MTTIYLNPNTTLPKRRDYEYYPTETNLIRMALQNHGPAEASTILDVAAGDGRWGQVAREFYPNATISGVELRLVPKPAGFDAWHNFDFLMWPYPTTYDLILSNPPYGPTVNNISMAEHFVRRSWVMLAPGGMMIFLLRLAFQAGLDRHNGLWITHPLSKLVVLSRRPSFYGGGTNGTDYALFIWRKLKDGRADGKPRCWTTELMDYERDRNTGGSNEQTNY